MSLSIKSTISIGLFIISFFYFTYSSSIFPHSSGPDELSSYDASFFIYKYNRLALFPQDKDRVVFTSHGGTRTQRPPLTYITSALIAKLLSRSIEVDSINYSPILLDLFRKGSNLFGALTVLLTFLTINLLFKNIYISLTASFLLLLLPQFSFLSSYHNDDITAIFSSSFLIYSLIRLREKPDLYSSFALIGLSGGLVIISKATSWVAFPFLLILFITFIRPSSLRFNKALFILSLMLTIGGGWWIAFNIYNYGFLDPLQLGISKEVISENVIHLSNTYQGKGISVYDLIILNADNFITKTFASTIGHLDWLRILISNFTYALYLIVLFIASLSIPLVITAKLYCKRSVKLRLPPTLFLNIILILIIIFQFTAFVWTNLVNDIQAQGKYLLPVILPLIILFSFSFYSIINIITLFINRRSINDIKVNFSNLSAIFFVFTVFTLLISHSNDIRNYVTTYYERPYRKVELTPFREIELVDYIIGTNSDVTSLESTSSGITISSSGQDPSIVFSEELCQLLLGNSIISFNVRQNTDTFFQFFWSNDSLGFTEKDSLLFRTAKDTNEYIYSLNIKECGKIRIDPRNSHGQTTISNFKYSNIKRIFRPQCEFIFSNC